jgi:hypothetical protein
MLAQVALQFLLDNNLDKSGMMTWVNGVIHYLVKILLLDKADITMIKDALLWVNLRLAKHLVAVVGAVLYNPVNCLLLLKVNRCLLLPKVNLHLIHRQVL